MTPRRKAWLQNVALALGSAAACGLALEGAARLLPGRPQTIVIEDLGHPVGSGARIEIGGASSRALIVPTPTGSRLWRSSRATIRNHHLSGLDVEITTNSLGFRGAELGPKTAADFRVLFLGDSIVFGGYLPTEYTLPARIEATLSQDPPPALAGRRVQVINAAVPGIDLQTELAILMETGLSVSPDVVLVGLYLNDAAESPGLRIARLPPLLQRSWLLALLFERVDAFRARYTLDPPASRGLVSFEEEKARLAAGGAGDFDREVLANFEDWGYAWSDGYWRTLAPLLRILLDVARERGFALAVVLFPVRLQVRGEPLRDEPQRRFRSVMEELGTPHLDLLPPLRERQRAGGEELFYDWCHYTPAGTRFVGELVARFLAAQVIGPR